MTDDERATARAREKAAFLRGHAYGCEQTINAHDPLLGVVIEFAWVTWAWIESVEDADEKAEALAALRDIDDRVHRVMDDVRKVRTAGGVDSLALFEVEQRMAVEA
jgi:hypothetical protein